MEVLENYFYIYFTLYFILTCLFVKILRITILKWKILKIVWLKWEILMSKIQFRRNIKLEPCLIIFCLI
jgi:hypothetical protein